MRDIDPKELAHELMGDSFAQELSEYDTQRRLEVLIDDFLIDSMVHGKKALDVGCGLGFFSERLVRRSAEVTAVDLGPNLVRRAIQRAGCKGEVVDALRLVEHFGPESFDLVVSSECIEHTPSPTAALQEMCRVLRPGGYLSVSTPNVLWCPVVKLANLLGLRRFESYENFSSWRSIRTTLHGEGIRIQREMGLHLYPFQLGWHSLSAWLDRHAQPARALMINICVLGQKGESAI